MTGPGSDISNVPFPFYIKGREDVIFIHIPKTAGTSFIHSFNFNPADRNKGFRKHYHATEIIDLIGPDKWAAAFKWSFVRNPWDRLFSLYRFRKRKKETDPNFLDLDFESFLSSLLEEEEPDSKNRLRASQTSWLQNSDGTMSIDFIGRFENIDEDFKKLCDQLSIKTRLLRRNVSFPKTNYRDHYTPFLKDLVARHYEDDIVNFGYDF